MAHPAARCSRGTQAIDVEDRNLGQFVVHGLQRAGCSDPASRRRPRIPDGAASDIVGNVLMIGITVLLAAALAFSLSSTTEPSDNVNAEVAIEAGSALDARHVGGEDIPVEGSFFVLTLDDGEERIALADFPGDVSEGRPDHWELGEDVCVSCEAGGEVQALTFTTERQVLLEWTRPP